MKKKWYLTAPIFYPNANLHLGHAFTTTLSDILVRYHRARGDTTYFLTGSDENTQKVVLAAKKENKPVPEFLDEIIANFKQLFAQLDISYDQFIRTSDQNAHWPGAIKLWKRLESSGDLYKKEYEGLYCVGHEAFITEKELVNGKCPDHDLVPEKIREENYFFRLSRYGDEIKKRIEADEMRIIPETRKNEILSFINEGLEDVSFSRPKTNESIGIITPGDESQVMYVWCDALSSYITALGYSQDDTLYKKFWPADLHVIGKDILRFHAAIWPGMLLSAGIPLPKTILVHGLINSGGRKMSKSLGNVIDPVELLDRYGTDSVRYFLARHISPFGDGDITEEGVLAAYNADLANGLGNQVARIMRLATDHLKTPAHIPEEMKTLQKPFCELLDSFEVNRAIELVWQHIARTDQWIQEKKPFALIKSESEAKRAEALEIIERLVQHLALIATHLQCFMPKTAEVIMNAVETNTVPPTLFPRK